MQCVLLVVSMPDKAWSDDTTSHPETNFFQSLTILGKLFETLLKQQQQQQNRRRKRLKRQLLALLVLDEMCSPHQDLSFDGPLTFKR